MVCPKYPRNNRTKSARRLLSGSYLSLIHIFTDVDRELLLSIKRGSPKWDLLAIDGVEALPAVRWKLQNLEKLGEKKRDQLIEQLTKLLMKKEIE